MEREFDEETKFSECNKCDKRLAEIIGIHFGDGCLQTKHNYTYRIGYSLDSRNTEYIQYVKDIFKSVLDIELRGFKEKRKNAVYLYYFSKKICAYFTEVLQIPESPKTNLRIPPYN